MFDKIIFALPKGRLAGQIMPVLERVGITPEPAFFTNSDRRLVFDSNIPGLKIVPVKPFDVATYVAHGAADMGIVGADVMLEFNYDSLYAPVDLGLGPCRLCLAVPKASDFVLNPKSGHLKIATKYPNFTSRYYAHKGIQCNCIKLNGSIELAPLLGISGCIVDLVSTGETLNANDLVIHETLAHITSRFVVGRAAFKARPRILGKWVDKFREVVVSMRDPQRVR